MNLLTAKACDAAGGGARRRLADGGNLYLNIAPNGTKSWVFLFTDKRAGRKREIGLGGYPSPVGLARAREEAHKIRDMIADGLDPVVERSKGDVASPTFGQVADSFVDGMEAAWDNPKHRAQWRMTLGDVYCKTLRLRPIGQVATADVLTVLNPIWQKKPETASRLRGRIERVLDHAKAKGLREGENPARWRGHLDHILPPAKKLSVRGHHAAMPYADVPDFMRRLHQAEGLGACALEITILTAARSSEVLNAKWKEFDLDSGVWTVPAARMKARRDHRVPLCARAIEILKAIRAEYPESDWVFPGHKRGKPLSNMTMAAVLKRMKLTDVTVHGFRSAFRDWAAEETSFPREIAEAALAHVVGDATERAYRRGDALEKRRTLMDAWSKYLTLVQKSSPLTI
ncbi:MAG: tyrosine-type recombinase/integrase [Mesorhizobium sp.]|nr:tyrosine-type recombinase/integrase [Mesorhizobium sp.]